MAEETKKIVNVGPDEFCMLIGQKVVELFVANNEINCLAQENKTLKQQVVDQAEEIKHLAGRKDE